MENFKPQVSVSKPDENIEKPFSKEDLSSFLKRNAVDLLSEEHYFKDFAKNNVNGLVIKPFTWNENSGVIIFNDGERTYVVKSSDEITSKLNKNHQFYTHEVGLGVPHVDDEGIWASKGDFDYFMKRFNNQ